MLKQSFVCCKHCTLLSARAEMLGLMYYICKSLHFPEAAKHSGDAYQPLPPAVWPQRGGPTSLIFPAPMKLDWS